MITPYFKYLLSLAFALLAFNSFAQNEEIKVFGQLKDSDTKKKLDGITIQVYKDGSMFDTYDAGTTGKYEFNLPLGFTYDFKFTKPEYSTKIIRIDTRNIPAEDRLGGFESNIDGELFKVPEGFNVDLLKEPMAKAYFDSQTNSIEFDFEYTEKRIDVIAAEKKRLEDLAKNIGKLQGKFDDLVKQGDQKMTEKKYSDAVDKYTEALTVIKDKEPAKSKLVEAKKKLDEENANKDAEAKYQKMIDDGDAAYKKANYADAKKLFTDASKLKPGEQYPKDKLAQIADAEKNGAKRAEYDKIIANADAKFQNKDYAVSIENYREASSLLPAESYPKDQILKAQRALDDMLSDEAGKQKREAEYQAKILAGEQAMADDKLEQALKAYKDAGNIKPEEALPQKKIPEIEKLIADRKKKADENNANAAADDEKARLEKEYNEHIASADAFFDSKEFKKAKEEYKAALAVKADAQYPKQRLQRIDLLMEEDNDAAEKARRKAEEDSLRNARAAANQGAAMDKTAMQLKEKEDRERRAAELQDQRIAEQEALIEQKRERKWESNADEQAEIAVENFYQDALKTEQQSRYNDIKIIAKNDSISKEQNRTKQKGAINGNETSNNEKLKAKEEIESNGTNVNKLRISDTEAKKEEANKNTEAYVKRSTIRQADAVQAIDNKEEQANSLPQNDRYRKARVEDTQAKKEKEQEQQTDFIKAGNERIANNNMKVEETMEKNAAMTFAGEEKRVEREQQLEKKMSETAAKNKDLVTASDERIVTAQSAIDKKSETYKNVGEGNDLAERNAKTIKDSKELIVLEQAQTELDMANKRHEERMELIKKDKGQQKDESLYPVKPGTEKLPEGVTENSYELGNKKVTERIVKIGNKVDVYKKVVSKTGIYFFKNERSITETIWRQETLREN